MHWVWPFTARGGNDRQKPSCAANSGPDFLCIGAQKGGTTWLYHQLETHPDFWMPPFKELHYFDALGRVDRASVPRQEDERDSRFLESLKRLGADLTINLQNYARLFEPKGSLLSGDITPTYSILSKKVIRQIARSLPKLKVIFLARDPIERLWSHLSMEVSYHQIEPFDVADIQALNRNLRRRGLLLRSYPSRTVTRWKRYLRPELFRVFFFDDLEKNPDELRRSILLFLGADPERADSERRTDYNAWSGMEKLPLPEHVRSHLAQFFRNELKACAIQLGGRAREWPARYGF